MNLSTGEIASILNLTAPSASLKIEHLLFDSRQVVFPAQSLFFAFRSLHNNGHQYIPELIDKGVNAFVVSEKHWQEKYPQQLFFLVEDVLRSLQEIAAFHRDKFNIPMIAITGSNGKTIVKEWLADILADNFQVVKNPKSYNSQIGVPFSLSLISDKHQVGIFEAGISELKEMEKLQKIIKPTFGIFTNIGSAHAAGFESTAIKIQEKAKLFSDCEQIIYCKDHTVIHEHLKDNKAKHLTWSSNLEADLKIISCEKSKKQSIISFEYEDKLQQLTIPFTDEASIENMMHCLLAALSFGLSLSQIQQKVHGLKPVEMRLEVLEGENNCLIINDSYNSDLESLTVALQFLKSQQVDKEKLLILSDFLQFGEKPNEFYKKVAAIINQHEVNRLFTVGNEIIQCDPYLSAEIERRHFTDTLELEEYLDQHKLINAQILIKGSRKFTFEKISNSLIKKQHQAKLEINLSALGNNYDFFKSKLSGDTKMLCMVKASGYGSGGIEIAKTLAHKNCDYLGVAYTDEGLELREAGIDLPILVLNAEPSSCKRLINHRLEPEIYSISQLNKFIAAMPFGKSLNIHLKLDTGMSRLGLDEKELPTLIEILKKHPQLKVVGVMSHLAASEDHNEDEFTQRQVESFKRSYEQLKAAFSTEFTRHLLNSAGILRFPQYHFELVRLGIGLYGVDPMNKGIEGLESVLSLKASISQIKNLEAGATVGYARKGRVNETTKIAVVNIGYADGLLRKAGNGAFSLLLRGEKAPTIGNICMDMCMIDITNIPDVNEGDEVIIFGKEQGVEQLSKVLDTIPYEIFTSISERVKRVYYKE